MLQLQGRRQFWLSSCLHQASRPDVLETGMVFLPICLTKWMQISLYRTVTGPCHFYRERCRHRQWLLTLQTGCRIGRLRGADICDRFHDLTIFAGNPKKVPVHFLGGCASIPAHACLSAFSSHWYMKIPNWVLDQLPSTFIRVLAGKMAEQLWKRLAELWSRAAKRRRGRRNRCFPTCRR